MQSDAVEPQLIASTHVANWEYFIDIVDLPRQLTLNVRNPEFENLLDTELSQERHAFGALALIDDSNTAGTRVSLARVDERWWTFMQHGAKLELYETETVVEPPTPIYQFLEPLWGSIVLLPWAAAVDASTALSAAKRVLLGDKLPSVVMPQLPEQLGLGRLEHHFKSPLDFRDFDHASAEFARPT